jgi:nucleoside-diphosphate-sugar epimerase
MSARVLVTGAAGLVGSAVSRALRVNGFSVTGVDVRAPTDIVVDVRDPALVRELVEQHDGVLHLAAVSRVVWAERDPGLCWSTNVGGTRNVLAAATGSTRRPWVVFASSREIYGQAETLPVDENSPARPINAYGRSKVAGEKLVEEAQSSGVRAATLRLSNAFGAVDDYPDRVVPAFVRAAIEERVLRVEGAEHTFDFTHIDDVVDGILALAKRLANGGAPPPPIQLVTGRGTTLRELAETTLRLSGSASAVLTAPERDYDVARFRGRPDRARELLGWSARVPLEEGLRRMIDELRARPVARP